MNKKVLIFLLLFIILIIFKQWFMPGLITGGDFWPVYASATDDYYILPHSWSSVFGNGLGQSIISIPWLGLPTQLPVSFLGVLFGNQWTLIQRVGYLWPFLLINLSSSFFLSKKIFKNNSFCALSSFLFLLNTYSLMVIEGGQIFVAISYSLAPLSLVLFMNNYDVLNKSSYAKLRSSIKLGLVLAVQLLIDIRISYVTILSIVLLSIIRAITQRLQTIPYTYSLLFISLTISVALNAFWALPTLLLGSNPLNEMGAAYSSTDAVRFFSFAKLENTISLLHPNWPENIFGKVYFMKAEFLLLPILAYSSLFFVSKKKDPRTKNYILYFALLGLLGAFLAKGANEPFGSLYLWMFEHVPGFNMFRDSTKWYTLIAISYSILIPFSISKIYTLLNVKLKTLNSKLLTKIKNYLPKIFLILTTLYLILLIHPALLGQLGGTLKSTQVHNEYIQLEKFIHNQPQFFRTMWIPTSQRFGYYSSTHPAISARDYFKKYDLQPLLSELRKQSTVTLLQDLGVKYIIVPYDSESEIFLTDRKYDEKKYKETVSQLDRINQLKKVKTFGKVVTYEIQGPKDHFWTPQTNLKINYKYINPSNYQLNVQNAKRGDVLVFAESFDKGWFLSNPKFKVQSSKFNNKFNSFVLQENGDYNLEINYAPQKWVDIGIAISVTTLATISLALVIIKRK